MAKNYNTPLILSQTSLRLTGRVFYGEETLSIWLLSEVDGGVGVEEELAAVDEGAQLLGGRLD